MITNQLHDLHATGAQHDCAADYTRAEPSHTISRCLPQRLATPGHLPAPPPEPVHDTTRRGKRAAAALTGSFEGGRASDGSVYARWRHWPCCRQERPGSPAPRRPSSHSCSGLPARCRNPDARHDSPPENDLALVSGLTRTSTTISFSSSFAQRLCSSARTWPDPPSRSAHRNACRCR